MLSLTQLQRKPPRAAPPRRRGVRAETAKTALTLCLNITVLSAIEITGRVVDPGGASVPSANVTVVQTSPARAGSAVTDATGRFRIVEPGPGTTR